MAESPGETSSTQRGSRPDRFGPLLKAGAVAGAITALIGAVLAVRSLVDIIRPDSPAKPSAEQTAELVERVNRAVTGLLVDVQSVEVIVSQPADRKRVAEQVDQMNRTYRKWETEWPALEGRIRQGYSEEIADDWKEYAQRVTRFYALTGIFAPAARRRQARSLTAYFGGGNTDALVDREIRKRFLPAWGDLRKRVLARKDEFVRRIDESV